MTDVRNEIFVGKLGKDPELKYTRTQKAICYLSIAVKDFGSEETNWKKVKVWEKQAELAKLYLKKGSDVFVQGRISRREFTGDDGIPKSYEEVNANLIGFSNM